MDDVEVGVADASFGSSPSQRGEGPGRAVDADDHASASHGRAGANDSNGPGGELGDPFAHRPEEQSFEAAGASGTEDDEVGGVTGLE